MDERRTTGGNRRIESEKHPDYRQGMQTDSMRKRSTSERRSAENPRPENRPVNPSRQSGRPRPKRKNSRRRRKQKLMLKIVLFFALIIAIIGTVLFWVKYGPTKKTYDLNKYFGIESENQMGLTINNEVVEAHAKKFNDHVYVPYEVVTGYLNQRFYWDENENILLYTLPKEIVRVDVGSNQYSISKKTEYEEYVILKTEGNHAYIALDFVKKYTALDYKVFENPERVVINSASEVRVATVKGKTQVRLRGGVKSPVLAEVKKGDLVQVIDQVENWKKVRTDDGIIGYMRASRLKKDAKKVIDRDFHEEEFTNISESKTINLAFHQVTSRKANETVLQTIAKTKGLTTLSPTWFTVANNSGDIKSIASSDYVNYAHQSGIDVWGLVDNFGENIDSMELLSHTSARENMVNQLISEALQSGIDGINVDFEDIPTEAGPHYIQFIRELSVKCRLNNLVLSVDNYVPKGFNAHYAIKEQGVVADYVIIMGYDEHYSGSKEAGSVASYDYVKDGIETTLKDVPAEKVINAVPFYTRLWKEVPKTEEELEAQKDTEDAEYPNKVSSEAFGMQAALNKVKDAGAEVVWDDKTKQNYAEWTGSDGAVYKIWLEDEKSLAEKLQLMKDYKLAGTAAWKLGFESSDIWELILKYVN